MILNNTRVQKRVAVKMLHCGSHDVHEPFFADIPLSILLHRFSSYKEREDFFCRIGSVFSNAIDVTLYAFQINALA